MNPTPAETFPLLDTDAVRPLCRHAFIGRILGLDVNADRETALARLADIHTNLRRELGFHGAFVTAEQVHGARVAVADEALAGSADEPLRRGNVTAHLTPPPLPAADALITNRPGVCLGIYVADCCAVYAVDPHRRAIGLAHSGRKGTELGIVPAMLRRMAELYGSDPAQLLVQLAPCIRPPLYELDFAAEIARQCREAGVLPGHFNDCQTCTGANPARYYSYRVEKGRTGRMLALLALA